MTQVNTDDDFGNKVLWQGRTHFKILFKPAIIQLFLIAVHVLLAMWLPTNTGLAWWDNWGAFSLHTLIVLVEIWYVVVPVLQWINARYTITETSVISLWGVIYKQSREIPLDSIVSISMERGILDRIFGCGTLVFLDAAAGYQPQTSGAWNKNRDKESKQGVRFADVPRVTAVQKLIEQARGNSRRRGSNQS